MVDKSSSEGIRSKKKKTMGDEGEGEGEGGGGINSLPDCMLHHVLSFLTMEQAVQASLVSKRWRYLWTSLPTLNFTRTKEYMEFVDSVLLLRDTTCNIQRLSITKRASYGLHYFPPPYSSSFDIDREEEYYSESDYDSDEGSESDYVFEPYPAKKPNNRLNIWIRSAIRRNLEEIHLEIRFGESVVELPNCLFTCKTLRKLELISLDSSDKPPELILPDSISLPRLEILHLEGLTLHHEDDLKINDFISNCCNGLESLILYECGIHGKNLNIVAHKLKHFVINGKYFMKRGGGATGSVRLYAPNLISFHCKDYLSKSYYLENVSSLVEAYIDMIVRAKEKREAGVQEKGRNAMIHGDKIDFSKLHNVKHLRLSSWAFQIVIATYELLDSASTEFHNLKSLRLQTWLSGDCIGGITWLLNNSPNIMKLSVEILILDTITPTFTHWNERKLHPTDMPDNGKWPLQCVLNHLKIVEIRGLKGLLNELKFLAVLLKNAVVLKKLSMFFFIDSPITNDAREKLLIEYREILQSYPRASSSVTILFF